jgi:hypothetical protein
VGGARHDGKLGLDRMLQGRNQVERRVRDLIEAMIIQRIIAPGSELALHRALAPETATSILAPSMGLTQVAEREVYAALDWLVGEQARIEAALARKHLVDTLVLYDVSSSYMEFAQASAAWTLRIDVACSCEPLSKDARCRSSAPQGSVPLRHP